MTDSVLTRTVCPRGHPTSQARTNHYASMFAMVLMCAYSGDTIAADAKCAVQPASAQFLYRGILNGPKGSPVSDGVYRLTIRIYETFDANSSLWETKQRARTVRGAYTIPLTPALAGDPSPPQLDDRYIEVVPEARLPSQPRQRLSRTKIPVNAEKLMQTGGTEGKTLPDKKTLDCMQAQLAEYRRTYWSVVAHPTSAPKPPVRTGESFAQEVKRFNELLRTQFGGRVNISCQSSPCLLRLDANGDQRRDLAVQVAGADGRLGIALQMSDKRIELLGADSRLRLPERLQSLQGWQVVQNSSLQTPPADMKADGIYLPGADGGILLYGARDGLKIGKSALRSRGMP